MQPALTVGDALAAASTRCTVAQRRVHKRARTLRLGHAGRVRDLAQAVLALACAKRVRNASQHASPAEVSSPACSKGTRALLEVQARRRRVRQHVAANGLRSRKRAGRQSGSRMTLPLHAEQQTRLLVVRAREGHAARVRHDLRRRAASNLSMRAESGHA